MIVDANILLYAVDADSPHCHTAGHWLEAALNGNRRVGLPWTTLGAFVRIITHPRVTTTPLPPDVATDYVRAWLAAPAAWIPPASERTAAIFGELTRAHHVTGNLVPDAMLAALALEHGLDVVSADSDFARFPEVRWHNPLA